VARVNVVNWNGKDVPPELRELPAGRYVLAPVDAGYELSPEEEAGLDEALDEIDRGETVPWEEVRADLDKQRPR
jgi:hypothetical protein